MEGKCWGESRKKGQIKGLSIKCGDMREGQWARDSVEIGSWQGMPETWDTRHYQWSYGVALVETLINEYMESEVTSFCRQVGHSVGDKNINHSQIFSPKIGPIYDKYREKIDQRIKEWPASNWSNLRPIKMTSNNLWHNYLYSAMLAHVSLA